MQNVELVGLHDDGESLVLIDGVGQRYQLFIDEALRVATRRDRPRLEQLRAEQNSPLRPRDIQARIRAGQTAEEVAEEANMQVEQVRRYEGPVLAEREYVAEQARMARLDRASDGERLSDLVADRLQLREVRPGSVRWDAFRVGGDPWTVIVYFTAGNEQIRAAWRFDQQARSVTPLDDEALWLSEQVRPDSAIANRRLAAVRDVVFDVETNGELKRRAEANNPRPTEHIRPVSAEVPVEKPPTPSKTGPINQTEAILEKLEERRGHRQRIDPDAGSIPDDLADEIGTLEALESFADIPGAHTAESHPEEAVDAEILVLPEPVHFSASVTEAPTEAVERPGRTSRDEEVDTDTAERALPSPDKRPRRPANRTRRSSVPSWDDIVFGSKHE